MIPDDILLIGDGFVGKASRYALNIKDYTSQPANEYQGNLDHYKYFMLCVPTPTVDGKQDLSPITSWLDRIDVRLQSAPDPVVIIRSTILPGTTDKLSKDFNLTIAHIPEFLSEATAIEDELNPEFVVIGCRDIIVKRELRMFFQGKLNLEDNQYILCDPTTAELIKYTMNSFFALKVIFGNQIFDVAKESGAKYDLVVRALEMHKWGSVNGWNVWHGGFRGFNGKCLIPSTLIFTSTEIKEIKDLNIGDKILTHNGTEGIVTKIYKREVNEYLFHVETQGAGEINITHEHPVLAIRTNRKYELRSGKLKFSNSKKNICKNELEWIDVDDLEKGDFLVIPRIKINPINLFSSELMRLLGYYLANGSIYKNRVTICFNSKHFKSIQDAKNIIENNFGKVFIQNYKTTVVNLRLTNIKLADFLIENANKYAHLKKLSNEIMLHDNNRLIELMRGYFRCDGSLSCGHLTMATVSKLLFYQLQIILNRLGIAYTVKENPERISSDGTHHKYSYYLSIRNQNEIEKCIFVDKDKIPQKDLKLRRSTSYIDNDFYYIPIKYIEKIKYKGFVYNLEIKDKQTYVTSAGVVHNCLPKDLYALTSKFKIPLLDKVREINKKLVSETA